MRRSTAHRSGEGIPLLWFPAVFAALLGALALNAYTNPRPHGMQLGVVASTVDANSLTAQLNESIPDGFNTHRYNTPEAAEDGIRKQEIVAAVIRNPGSTELLIATAASKIRANYLEQTLGSALAEEEWPTPVDVTDVVPLRPQDATGNAMMFWGLPLLVAGFLASILLLPYSTWSLARKMTTIAYIAAASSAAVYGLAVCMQLLPSQPLLLVYGFTLAQTIAWLCIGIAPFARRYVLVVTATFVLVLGIPSAAGTVPTDLLPVVPRYLSKVMPLAQTISLARASAYFGGHGFLRPLSMLLGWALLGALLLVLAERRASNPGSILKPTGA